MDRENTEANLDLSPIVGDKHQDKMSADAGLENAERQSEKREAKDKLPKIELKD